MVVRIAVAGQTPLSRHPVADSRTMLQVLSLLLLVVVLLLVLLPPSGYIVEVLLTHDGKRLRRVDVLLYIFQYNERCDDRTEPKIDVFSGKRATLPSV